MKVNIDDVKIMKVCETDTAITGYTCLERGTPVVRAEVRDILTEVKAFLTMADYFVVAKDAKRTGNTDSLKMYSISNTINKVSEYLKDSGYEFVNRYTTYVAYIDKTIVGTLVVSHGSLTLKNCNIFLVYVENAYRKNGIATKLINMMMKDVLTKRGLDGSRIINYRTGIMNHNKSFANLCKKLGFKIKKEYENYNTFEKKVEEEIND